MSDLITNNVDIQIKDKIYTVRGLQVMLDMDLADIYNVEPKRLNEQVKRNIERFPEKFRFQLTKDEYENLRSQFATLSLESESSTTKSTWGKHTKYLPHVFTEQGVSMLSAVLTSKAAVEVSIKIMDSFVNMRKFISANNTVFQRLETLEQNQLITSSNIDKIFTAIEAKTIKEQTSGIFFKDQMYDAHSFILDLLRKSNKSIVLIDNYIDDITLTLFSKVPDIKVTIYTHTQTKQLKLDLEKYKQQYSNITIKTFKESHDRFLILDDNEVYLIGASLKDLGKKWFGFSKLDISSIDNILKRLE